MSLHKSTHTINQYLAHWKVRGWRVPILIFLISGLILYWQKPLEGVLAHLKVEHRINRDLAQNRDARLHEYQKIVSSSMPPKSSKMLSNEWIRHVQALVRQEGLALRELKPISQSVRNSTGAQDLFVELEGEAPNFLKLLYRIAEAKDIGYISKFNFSTASQDFYVTNKGQDKREYLTAQITLSQYD